MHYKPLRHEIFIGTSIHWNVLYIQIIISPLQLVYTHTYLCLSISKTCVSDSFSDRVRSDSDLHLCG